MEEPKATKRTKRKPRYRRFAKEVARLEAKEAAKQKPKRERAVTKTQIEANLRRLKAVEMRTAGMSYAQISERLNIPVYRVYNDIAAVMKQHEKEMSSSIEFMRIQQELRLDRMLEALRPGIESGDQQSIMAAIRIEDRRAKLRGLDSPAKSEISGPNGAPIQVTQPTVYIPCERVDSECEGLPELTEGDRRLRVVNGEKE